MKLARFGAALLLAVTLLVSPCFAADLPQSGSLTPAQTTELMNDLGNNLVVLDVRTEAEFHDGHVKGAINIPVEELVSRIQEVPEGKPMLIICRSGHRASIAFKILREQGRSTDQVWYLTGYTDYSSGAPRFYR
ncbi:rhodanese-like domain-containing protein [uncultured Mailhella sp.]|uniref:rhodanese-like domain-containing protein n=1 Tax=uncultured Mailhella sp. TaxID=1981031 RepID=UPI0025E24A63|nr:rhodanese-like domain-containing protein [uncultured Mailhella sp.]